MKRLFVISGVRREVDKNCALLIYYAGSSGNYLPTFRDNIFFLFSRVKDPRIRELWTLNMLPMGSCETSVRTYYYSLRNGQEKRSTQEII
jgi:hypothetical protein